MKSLLKLIDLVDALVRLFYFGRNRKREVDAEGTTDQSIDSGSQIPVEKALNNGLAGGPTLNRPSSVFTRVRKKRKTDSSVDD